MPYVVLPSEHDLSPVVQALYKMYTWNDHPWWQNLVAEEQHEGILKEGYTDK